MGIKTRLVLGLPERALPITKEDKFGLRGEPLRGTLEEEDHARGKHPFVVGESTENDVPTGMGRIPNDLAPCRRCMGCLRALLS